MAVGEQEEGLDQVERIALRGQIVPKKRVLDNPEAYRKKNIVVFEIDKKYYGAAKKWATHNSPLLHDLLITIGYQSREFSEIAFKLFWAVCTEITKHMGDETRKNKEVIHDWALNEMMHHDIDGHVKTSLKELDKRELWQVTQVLWDKLSEYDSDPYHLRPQYNYARESYEGVG